MSAILPRPTCRKSTRVRRKQKYRYTDGRRNSRSKRIKGKEGSESTKKW